MLVRAFLIAFGALAIMWGGITLPLFWQQGSIERVSRNIISGEQFNAKDLADQQTTALSIESLGYCRPEAMRGGATISIRYAQDAILTGAKRFNDPEIGSLINTIRISLSCAPADAFLWLAYYWVEINRGEMNADTWAYLRMSYLLGPNESWIGLKRNPLAFGVLSSLPHDLAERALDEFIALLVSGFYNETAQTYADQNDEARKQLESRLSLAPERSRRELANSLFIRGYNFWIPGIVPNNSRPWR